MQSTHSDPSYYTIVSALAKTRKLQYILQGNCDLRLGPLRYIRNHSPGKLRGCEHDNDLPIKQWNKSESFCIEFLVPCVPVNGNCKDDFYLNSRVSRSDQAPIKRGYQRVDIGRIEPGMVRGETRTYRLGMPFIACYQNMRYVQQPTRS